MRIRRTEGQVTSLFMMAAVTSQSAPSSGSCWSNLCCFGYDIDPTHWKERVRDTERACERRCIRWTCGQKGLLEGSSKISLAKKLHFSHRSCFIKESYIIRRVCKAAPSHLSIHLSVRLSTCPVGVAVPTARLPSDEFSLNSIFGNFPKICRQIAILLEIRPK